MLRQQYAKTMIDLLIDDWNIINVDESWINETNFTNMMWCSPNSTGSIALNQVTPRLSLIASLDTSGNVYYSLSQVNTDSDILMLFMRYLIKHLDLDSPNWREKSIILLDGAKYHTSDEMREYFCKMEVNVIYSGLYSYSAAPIETLFSALK